MKRNVLKTLAVLFLVTSSAYLYSQEINRKGPSVDFGHGKLKVDKSGRFLIFDDSKPFFFLGDTGWELLHKLNTKEASEYLENRRLKGFTVILAVAISEFDGLNSPNAYGEVALINQDPLKPNDKYFNHIDTIIRIAETKGIFVAVLPTWGDKVDKQWGKGPVVFNKDNAYNYGQWIGKRYKDFKNIIWIIGGDRQGGGNNYIVWDAMARGIKMEDQNHLMTFHPVGWRSSSEWFQNTDWLDFNMLQSSHGQQYIPNYKLIGADYNLKPVKPCLDGEFCYEEHPINWNIKNGRFDDFDVRRSAYWNFFAGACGLVYGGYSVFQFYDATRESVPLFASAKTDWHLAMDLPGAYHVGYLRNLIESRNMLSIVPDQTIIAKQSPVNIGHIVSLRGDSFAMVYAPASDTVTVSLNKFRADSIVAWWFNPRTGDANKIGVYANKGQRSFKVPLFYIDWVLVLDDKSKKFKAPGSI